MSVDLWKGTEDSWERWKIVERSGAQRARECLAGGIEPVLDRIFRDLSAPALDAYQRGTREGSRGPEKWMTAWLDLERP